MKAPHEMTPEEFASDHFISPENQQGRVPQEAAVRQGYEYAMGVLGTAFGVPRVSPAAAISQAESKSQEVKSQFAERLAANPKLSTRAKAMLGEAYTTAIDTAIRDAKEYYASNPKAKHTGWNGHMGRPAKRGDYMPWESRTHELSRVISAKYPSDAAMTSAEAHKVAVQKAGAGVGSQSVSPKPEKTDRTPAHMLAEVQSLKDRLRTDKTISRESINKDFEQYSGLTTDALKQVITGLGMKNLAGKKPELLHRIITHTLAVASAVERSDA